MSGYGLRGSAAALVLLVLCLCLYAVTSAQDDIVYHGRNVDINIVDADVVDVLLMLAEASDLNIVVDERVHDTLTLRLVDVPVDQAIEIILELTDLEAVTLNGAVVIRPIGGAYEDSPSEE